MNTRLRAERVPTSTGVRYVVDETCWAELPGLEASIDQRLARLDGWTPGERLHRGLSDEQQTRLDALVEVFRGHRLAVDDSARPPLHTIRVAVAGQSGLARSLAQALLRSGVSGLHILDPHSPDPLLWPGSRHATGGAALAASLRPRTGVTVRACSGVTELAEVGVDVVLVVPAAVEADRLLLDELVRHDLVHLVLGAHRDIARIGPLVQPGRTACMRCHDLARCDTDPSWPQVLAHLARLPARPSPPLASWVVSRAVLEICWLARGAGPAQRLAGTIELTDLQDPLPRTSRFGPHPQCGCGWLV